MPNYLSDPPVLLFGVIALVAIAPLAAALLLPPNPDQVKKKRQKRIGDAISVGSVLLLLGLILCDRFFESDREQMARKLSEMSAGVRENNLNKVFEHISDSFRKGSFDKASLKTRAEAARRDGQVTDLRIWDDKLESLEPTTGKATFSFSFKVDGAVGNNVPYRCKAYFGKEANGQWKLQGFDIFNPIVDQNTPMSIPGLQ